VPEEFRLGIGGPLYRLERAARVESLRRLIPLVIAVTWAPLVVLALVQRATTGGADSLIGDLSVHARLLVAMPLFLVAERFLDRIGRVTVARLFDEGYVPPSAAVRVRALLVRVQRWRDAALPETLLLAAAFLLGVLALVGWTAPAGAIHGLGEPRWDAVRIWYGLAALPIFQFVLWRALFRWALWLRVLFGLARVPLRLLPAHADRRAGIAFLKTANVFYCALMLMATSAVICGAWATQMATYGTPLATFRSPFFVLVILGLLVSFAPVIVFTPQLLRARIRGLREYGALVSDYAQRFETRWVGRVDRSDVLGTPDIQALSDLTNAYQHNIEPLGIFLFSRADWTQLLAATFIPAIPLLLWQSPAHEVVKRIIRILVGTMP
jgi:hypothetical protein